MPLTQANRNLAIGTPLGPDVLLLKSFSYTEQLGRLFQLEADVLSEKQDINFDQIVGKNVTIRLDDTPNPTRFFNGFVSRFHQSSEPGRNANYRMTIVPWLWFLTRTSDCRIFQKKKIPDIIKEVFRDNGFTDFREALTGTHTAWEYCVQYRETDFNFVSRLMEQEGIYYFWEHKNSKHTLVLADSRSAHKPGEGYAKISYRASESGGTEGGSDCIFDWAMEMEVQPGSYVLKDFNFEKPKTSLEGKSQIIREHDQAKFEHYDYPGEYEEQNEGTDWSQLRIEEVQAQHFIARGQTTVRAFSAGSTFTLQDAPRKDREKQYLLTSISLHVAGEGFEARGSAAEGDFFSCSFTAIEATQQYRAPRLTPKPIVQGPQTAIVTGPAGEEIHTDKYGRIKVLFHWDRHSKADENSSCWVRVSQAAWAGKKWGAMYIPRIGQEVIVEFLEGDPDLPIVTGRVYNADSMPPYDLPGEKTKTTLKSNSSKGGSGFNEFRFEDKKGSEQVFINAERNQDVRVKKDSFEYIGENRHLMVKKDQFESVDGDKHQEVKGQHNQKVGETLSLTTGQNIQEKAGMNVGVQAGQEIHLKAGMNVVIEAGMSITLKAGGGFVVVGPSGVTISGTPVLINSGGSAGAGSGISPTAPKPPIEADKAEPGQIDQAASRTPQRKKPTKFSPTAVALQQAAASGTPFCKKCAEAAAKRASQS